jgi:hypothetical protein
MIYYRVKTAFRADASELYSMVFGELVHSYSYMNPEQGLFFFGFDDDTVTPADLGPLVRVERVTDLSILP